MSSADTVHAAQAAEAAPLPIQHLTRHLRDADDFDAATVALLFPVTDGAAYEACEHKFGPITYGAQTDRAARREQSIRAREAELGLSPEDLPS